MAPTLPSNRLEVMSNALTLLDISAETSPVTGDSFQLPVVGRKVSFALFDHDAYPYPSVGIEGSFDGSNWFNLATVTASKPVGDIDLSCVKYVRGSYGGGSAATLILQAIQSDI